MLKPVRMCKVRAICLKAAAPQAIKELHNLSVLHIVDSEIPETERQGPLASFDTISSKLIAIRSMKEALSVERSSTSDASCRALRHEAKAPLFASQKEGGKMHIEKKGTLPKKKVKFENLLNEADAMVEKSDALAALLKEREEAQKELDSNHVSQASIAELQGLSVDFSAIACDSLKYMLLRVPAKKAKEVLAHLSHKHNCSFASTPAAEGSIIAIVGMPKDEDPKFLDAFGQAFPLPQIAATPKEELSSLKGKEGAIRKRLAATDAKLARFSGSNFARLVALDESLSIEAERAQAAASFGASASLYYIEGWAQEKDFERLQHHMKQKFNRKIFVEKGAIGHDETPPTELDNPKPAQPFQFLMDFMSLPQYSEIDPTVLLAVFIPLIYAVILGDTGFAVLSFILAAWMMKVSKKGTLLNQVALVWAISAIPAFFMGIIYDEYFGFTHTHLLSLFGFEHIQLYQGMHRVAEISTLMLISIIIGMVHVGLGFILGAINEWGHNRKHAYAKLSWLGIELSGFFLIAALVFNTFPILMLPSAAVFALSVVGLLKFEGVLSVIEIPGLSSNIMSYIRIAAVGVGGVIMAEAVNELLLPKLSLTPLGILAFIFMAMIYIAVQIAVCIIAMFESFVHGARLNVVEFFGKFYKGNGIRFAPFAAKRNYTQEV